MVVAFLLVLLQLLRIERTVRRFKEREDNFAMLLYNCKPFL